MAVVVLVLVYCVWPPSACGPLSSPRSVCPDQQDGAVLVSAQGHLHHHADHRHGAAGHAAGHQLLPHGDDCPVSARVGVDSKDSLVTHQ